MTGSTQKKPPAGRSAEGNTNKHANTGSSSQDTAHMDTNNTRRADLASPEAQVIALRSELDDLKLIVETLLCGLTPRDGFDPGEFMRQTIHVLPSGPWYVSDALAPSTAFTGSEPADRVRLALRTSFYADDLRRDAMKGVN